MNKIIILVFICLSTISFGQTEYSKSISLEKSENIAMYFKWPDVVTVKYHDKKEVFIEGTVSINYGQYDDKFEINISRDGNVLKIESEVRNMDDMEQITVIRKKGDKENMNNSTMIITDKDDSEYVSKGVMIDIFLTVYLPKSVPAIVESKFGLIEIKETGGPLVADSQFGGVDISINPAGSIDLKAGTAFGEIFTDLNIDFRGNGELEKVGKWHRVTSIFGSGNLPVEVESKFGNVYLRKLR